MEELSQGTIRQGLWGQALAESGGNEDSVRAKYLVIRVQSMMDEEEIRQFSSDELTKEINKQEREQAKAESTLERDKPDEPFRSPNLWNVTVFVLAFLFVSVVFFMVAGTI